MASSFDGPDNDVIIARARKGDPDALESIYRTHEASVFRLARRICGPGEAHDILQETFMEVIRSIGRYRGEAPLGVWIHRIAASKALMYVRRAQIRPSDPLPAEEILPSERGGPPPGKAGLDSVDMERFLSGLSPLTRAVLWLHDVEGYTHAEIAELAGRSESFSKSRLARAYQSLRTLVRPGENEGGLACTQA